MPGPSSPGDGGAEPPAAAAPSLSKSWTVRSSSVPSYSGGKITPPRRHGRGGYHLYGLRPPADGVRVDADDGEREGEGDEDGGGKKEDRRRTAFLLAPHDGDLNLLDYDRGTKVRSIRKGCVSLGGGGDDDNPEGGEGHDIDDDDGIDNDDVISQSLSPNGIDLIVVTRSNVLRQYDLSGNEDSYRRVDRTGPAVIRKTIGRSGHDLPVTNVEHHPSGAFFATGSVDGVVKVWDARGGYATHSFRPPSESSRRGGGTSVTCLSWRPDVTRLVLAVGRENGLISIHDLKRREKGRDAEEGAVLGDHVSAVTCLCWGRPGDATAFGDVLVSAGRDAVINTWLVVERRLDDEDEGGMDVGRKKKKRRKHRAEDAATRGAATSATIETYKRIRTKPVYEQVEGMVLLPPRCRRSLGSQIATGRRNAILVTAGSKGVVRMWKSTRPEREEAKGGGSSSSATTALSDWELVATQGDGSAFGEKGGGYADLLLSPASPSSTKGGGPSDELIAVDAEHGLSFLSLDGIGAKGKDKSLLRTTRTIVGHNDEILDLRLLPPLADRGDGGDSENNNDDTEEAESKEGDDDPSTAAPRTIAVATNSSQIRLFELGTYSCEVLGGHDQGEGVGGDDGGGHRDTVLALDVSPCGRYLASAGKDKTMRIWSLKSKRCVAVATGHTESVGATALSRKIGRYDVGGKAAANGGGAFAVTASRDRTMKLWRLPGPSELERERGEGGGPLDLRASGSVRAHDKDINVISVAPNDSLLATGSQDKTVKLWRPNDTLTLRGTLRGHKRGVWDCRFSPVDRVLATGSADRTIKLWSLSDLSCVRTFQGHASSVLRVRFLTGGLQLVSSGADGLLKLWTIRTNECEMTMDGHADKAWALDVSPDGEALVSGGADSKIVLWRDTTREREDARRVEEERNLLMEQKLSNHLRRGEHGEALEVALELDKPRQALKVLSAIVENDLETGKEPLSTLRRHVKSWPMRRVAQVLRYCREWNTRSRNSDVAMLVVRAVVSSVPATRLAEPDHGVPEILAGIAPYAERHFERLDRLYGSAYLIDYALHSMGSLDAIGDAGDAHGEKYSEWEKNSKYVLPPEPAGVGGSGGTGGGDDDGDVGRSSDEVNTIGESDTDSESDSSSSSSSSSTDESDGDANDRNRDGDEEETVSSSADTGNSSSDSSSS